MMSDQNKESLKSQTVVCPAYGGNLSKTTPMIFSQSKYIHLLKQLLYNTITPQVICIFTKLKFTLFGYLHKYAHQQCESNYLFQK